MRQPTAPLLGRRGGQPLALVGVAAALLLITLCTVLQFRRSASVGATVLDAPSRWEAPLRSIYGSLPEVKLKVDRRPQHAIGRFPKGLVHPWARHLSAAVLQRGEAVHALGQPLRRRPMKREVPSPVAVGDLSETVSPDTAMGTHFISTPENPARQRGPLVAQKQTQNERAGANGEHDLSESVAPDAAMGTHFVVSPEHPARSPALEKQGQGQKGGVHPISSDVPRTTAMGTHLITRYDPFQRNYDPFYKGAVVQAADGNAWAAAPTSPATFGDGDAPAQARVQDVGNTKMMHGGAAADDSSEFGTHMMTPDGAETGRLDGAQKTLSVKTGAAAAGDWSAEHVLSPGDRVGDSPYVSEREKARDQMSPAAFVNRPQDQVGDVEYTSGGDFAPAYAASPVPDAGTRGRRGAGEGGQGGGDNASKNAADVTREVAEVATSVFAREVPASSDAPLLPLGTNFAAGEQGAGYAAEDLVGARKKPFQSDFPLPWSGTNSVFIGELAASAQSGPRASYKHVICLEACRLCAQCSAYTRECLCLACTSSTGSHQGGDPTFSHTRGEPDAAPGTINTIARGAQGGYDPATKSLVYRQDPAERAASPPADREVRAHMGDPRVGAQDGPLSGARPPQERARVSQPVAPGGRQAYVSQYGVDAKARYEAKKLREQQQEAAMMGIPNAPAAVPYTVFTKGGPAS